MKAVSLGLRLVILCFAGLAIAVAILYYRSDVPGPRPLAPLPAAPIPTTVFLEEMTWPEVAGLLAQGPIMAIVPTGGVEQNGPHMMLGKHNPIVRHTAERIARGVGRAVVTPVLAYVPEGDIDPPTGHMIFPGTLSLPSDVFESVLRATAKSLHAHGFDEIAFLGDSGDSQPGQEAVARKLDAQWRDSGTRVWNLGAYYAENGQVAALQAEGETEKTIGRHAGIRDTSELLAVKPSGVRMNRLSPGSFNWESWSGTDGDPRRASTERGRRLLELKVRAAIEQINTLRNNSQ